MKRKVLFFLLITLNSALVSRAWVYPEHRDIAVLAIQKLDSSHKALLDRLWALARKGYESRLDTMVADGTQGTQPKYIDYAAWPGIAGDHSTSAGDMLNNILHTDWILDVADVTARLKAGLAASANRSERAAELRDSDLRLLRADPDYVSRAGSNNVHFMMARPDVNTSAGDYFNACFREGCELNLVATYQWYHTSALLKARRLASESLTPGQRSSLALAALADEAFALHFLEDGFASGHVAGIWGNAALRKGTHDYYDENGLEVTTWNGERLVLMGDAYMRERDAERAARTVLLSLEQFLDASTSQTGRPVYNDQPGIFSADTFNIARTERMPVRILDPLIRELCDSVLITVPVPGLATGAGEIPRFRAEIGPFVGIAPAARVSGVIGGFSQSQVTTGVVPGLEFAIHVGLGMDGVLNESGDGLVFLDLGWRLDGASSVKIVHQPQYNQFGSILSAIPSREAFYGRIRLPFYLIPGDLLILGPVMLLFAPKSLNKVVATAGQGGLIPWQSGLVTPIGRFQFILGREMGICFYGSTQGPDSFLVPDEAEGPGELMLITMRSTQLEFPFLEYRPVRTFSRRQSASLVLQLYAGLDIPGKVNVISPESEFVPKVKTTWMFGIRMSFDWRYYFAKKRTTVKH